MEKFDPIDLINKDDNEDNTYLAHYDIFPDSKYSIQNRKIFEEYGKFKYKLIFNI